MNSNSNSDYELPLRSDALYHTVFGAMADGVVVQAAGGRVIAANPAAAQILGMPLDELQQLQVPNPGWRNVRADGTTLPDAELPAIEALRTGAAVSDFVMGVERPDGATIWLSMNSRPLQLDGEAAVVTTFSDITALKQIEAELRESQARFRNILHNTPIGMAIVSLSGKLLQVNRALSEMIGYPEQDLLGLDFRDITHPDDLDADSDSVRQLLDGSINSYQIEKRYVQLGGDSVWILLTVSMLRDDSGEPLQYIVQVKDISERKTAERTVQQAQQQLRALVDTLPAWVAMIDGNGHCVIANRRYTETMQRPLAQIEGRLYAQLLPPALRERHAELIALCLAGEPVEFMEEYALREQGVAHVHGRYAPLYESGRVTGAVLVATDVSELKRAQLLLTELNDELLRRVTEIHDLQLKLQDMAVRDALTGLHNRRFLDAQLPRELARARRLEQPLCVALGDIDHFKKLNDTYGHQAGDAVLRALRPLFTGLVRESDLVCRWGGEEILIVMPDVPAPIALQRIERLREALAALVVPFGAHQLRVTISFGIAAYRADASPDDMIHAADTALYAAKAAGRNTSRLHEHPDTPR